MNYTYSCIILYVKDIFELKLLLVCYFCIFYCLKLKFETVILICLPAYWWDRAENSVWVPSIEHRLSGVMASNAFTYGPSCQPEILILGHCLSELLFKMYCIAKLMLYFDDLVLSGIFHK